MLPYNMLLHRATREAAGVKLMGQIVVIDEAHNLVETLAAAHSAQITVEQVIYRLVHFHVHFQFVMNHVLCVSVLATCVWFTR